MAAIGGSQEFFWARRGRVIVMPGEKRRYIYRVRIVLFEALHGRRGISEEVSVR